MKIQYFFVACAAIVINLLLFGAHCGINLSVEYSVSPQNWCIVSTSSDVKSLVDFVPSFDEVQ